MGNPNTPHTRLHHILLKAHDRFNCTDFISDDPISIPHCFTKKQDREISGFFAATLAWGNRKSIINSATKLMKLMDNSPYAFVLHHQPNDLKRLLGFVHRTFNDTDLLYFIEFFKQHYSKHESLENAFTKNATAVSQFERLAAFHDYFFSLPDAPQRTRKHVATPVRGSSCKRLNMYLRWMVREDKRGVDFGLWNKISPMQLMCPLDVHVDRVARQLDLLQRTQTDWRAVEELTAALRSFDNKDPVKFDFALFGLSVSKSALKL